MESVDLNASRDMIHVVLLVHHHDRNHDIHHRNRSEKIVDGDVENDH
jgi:hypothetical protein